MPKNPLIELTKQRKKIEKAKESIEKTLRSLKVFSDSEILSAKFDLIEAIRTLKAIEGIAKRRIEKGH